jgi:hypothetical protein
MRETTIKEIDSILRWLREELRTNPPPRFQQGALAILLFGAMRVMLDRRDYERTND